MTSRVKYHVKPNKVSEYIKSNPYPSYKRMCQTIGKIPFLGLKDTYTRTIHAYCSIIYDSGLDKHISIQYGELLAFHCGGYNSFLIAMYVLLNYTPLSESKNFKIRNASKVLRYYLHGVSPPTGNIYHWL